MMRAGDRLVVEVGPVAHGGHCVARHDGQVLFVRHALPGEQVEVVVTDVGRKNRFVRADAVAVLTPSPDRVEAPCAHARPGGCGGCDWQHASVPAQRALKATVLREQLARLGGITELGGVPLEECVDVVAVRGDEGGLGWRTRVRFAVGPNGKAGFRGHRSHEVHAVDPCPLTSAGVQSIGATHESWDGAEEIEVVASSGGDRTVVVEPAKLGRRLPADVNVPGLRGRGWVRENAAGREWRVAADGFWQVHPGAADTLVDVVRALLAPQPGEHLLDLYCGVGLFAGALAADLGEEGSVDAVEASVQACADARRNLHDLPNVRIHAAPVESWLLSPTASDSADLVVLDPPRSGAGTEVMDAVLDRAPRAIAYVACDPASLGRDLGHAVQAGWRVASVQGFDLFPMTHHLEAVALLLPPSR
ncbi:class I SAM-dependent RNA methyltransferase [Longivirga aurantiaca]|uniref:Class I SAM-dependent RNA methyltransferase n=1 Tax=Longivirga aurantiaca TaxID=1837743 RepID=A0ABW1T140_9ACTN